MRRSRTLAKLLRAVARHEEALPAKEAVHRMRVATRRLRAALRLLRLRDLDPDVKRLQDALGDVRDLQLQVAWLRDRDAALHRARQQALERAEAALQRDLRRWHSRTLPALLLAAAGEADPSRRKTRKLVRKRLGRLDERLERARAHLTPKALHRARISVKQVRYTIEVAKPSLPKRAVRLDSFKALQASLGELHDVDVRIGLVKHHKTLEREQREARERLAKIVAAELERWRSERVVAHIRKSL